MGEIGTVAKELSPTKTGVGYRKVVLMKNGVMYTPRVHRLILLTFVGPPPRGTECAHGNGIRHDNRLENLRWATKKENARDRVAHGTWQGGSGNGRAILSEADVIRIRRLRKEGCKAISLAKQYGVNPRTISRACCGGWSHVTDIEVPT